MIFHCFLSVALLLFHSCAARFLPIDIYLVFNINFHAVALFRLQYLVSLVEHCLSLFY
jgi:hypothetical protein